MEREGRVVSRAWSVVGLICLVGALPPVTADAGQAWSAWSPDEGCQVNIGDPDLAPDAFGLLPGMDFISAEEFVCSDPPANCDWAKCDSEMFWCSDSTTSNVYAAVEIPSGALITGMRVMYYDANSALEMSVRLRRAYFDTDLVRGDVELRSFMSSGAPGYDSVFIDIDPDITVVRRSSVGFATWRYQSYYLWATLPAGTFHRLRGVAIFWNRQISPAPASATFTDVPTGHWAFQHVEALVDSGITAGCGGTSFCPDSAVTRAQMAVFLAKALGLHWTY